MAFKRLAVVMAGGSGERFWPVSTRERPKQFLKLAHPDETLIEQAVSRARLLGDPKVATNETLRALTLSHCSELTHSDVWCEPHKRNTLGALVWTAANVMAASPNEEWKTVSLAILTADQRIAPVDAFVHCAGVALDEAERIGGISVIGIPPTRAETGFGYIEGSPEPGSAAPVVSFREKPDQDLAEEFVRSSRFLWNSGMFFLTMQTLLGELELQQKESASLVPQIAEALVAGDKDGASELFSQVPNVSFDKGVMEHAATVSVVRATFEWDDLGAWDALQRSHEPDENGNVAVGEARFLDGKRNSVYIEGTCQRVNVMGVEGLVVVVTKDHVLVVPESKAQDVKKFLN